MKESVKKINTTCLHNSIKVSQVAITERSVTRLRVHLPHIELDQENKLCILTKNFSNNKIPSQKNLLKVNNIQLSKYLDVPMKKVESRLDKPLNLYVKLKKIDKPHQKFADLQIPSPFSSQRHIEKRYNSFRSKSCKRLTGKTL